MAVKQTWIKKRHKVITFLIRPFLKFWSKFHYQVEPKPFLCNGRNYLILSNHQTDWDQFFIGVSLSDPVYYVAMEDVFSNGWVSRLIEWLVAPIPIMKASTDLRAVKTCIKVAREGGNVALFPEGNRTYSGTTCYIKPGVGSLAKKLGLPIAIYKIQGGYGIKPRWSDAVRKGTMSAGVTRVLEPEEYQALSADELYDLICKELTIDETLNTNTYENDTLAEGLERVIYVCPHCGFSSYRSKGNTITCDKCGLEAKYLPNMEFENHKPFKNIKEWYAFQEDHVKRSNPDQYLDQPLYQDKADLYEVIPFKNRILIKKDLILSLFGDRLELLEENNSRILNFEDIKAMACIADHKLNVFYQDKIYQFRGNKGFNALKYCNIYYHKKHIKENSQNGEFEFLGL